MYFLLFFKLLMIQIFDLESIHFPSTASSAILTGHLSFLLSILLDFLDIFIKFVPKCSSAIVHILMGQQNSFIYSCDIEITQSSNIKIIVRINMTNKSHKNKTTQNIEFLIGIGQFKLRLSLPKHTTVSGLLAIVKGYDALHLQYGPQGLLFIGLASTHVHPLVDYWLTQPSLDFTRFKRKLELKCLYASERRSDRMYIGEFQCLVCLGKGTYGAVYLVRSRITGALMALKRVAKQHIVNYQGLMTQFRQRKNLIRMGHNNHTVNLHACFQSREHFNFLMQYYPGGELFLHLSSLQRQKLSNYHVKQYFCQIILAVEYIHKKKVLYRDLKPENIFVDVSGHLRIGDFGMSKCDFQEEDFTASICGSEQYMAPEILENHNYNFSADFYSIGAILYEMLTGVPPYYHECQQFNQLRNGDKLRLELIKSMALDLSKATQNPYLQQLLSNLLHPDPQYRISNFQQIKNSPWLTGVDWKAIEHKHQYFPFAPDPTAPIDTYIGRQFLDLQDQVDEINFNHEDDTFSSEISEAFEYIRPESRKLLGLEHEANLVKPKSKGSVKEKDHRKDKCLPKKTNLSVALFDRDETVCDSVCSEPRAKGQNKENLGPLRRDRSKKFIVVNKPVNSGNTLCKTNSHHQTPLTRQKTQRGTLAPFNYQYSQSSSRNVSECAIRIPSECSSKRGEQKILKKTSSRGRQLGRGESRDKSKGKSIDKKLKETSLNKNGMMRRKEDKRILPTCSYKIKLT